MTEEPLNVRAALGAIWRRRLTVGVVAILGFIGGIAYSAFASPMPSATALVLLPPSPLSAAGAPTRSLSTQLILARSAPVLAETGRSLSPSIAPRELKRDIVVTAITQDVLQFTARGSTAQGAMRIANAVAKSYIAYATHLNSHAVALLRSEARQLQSRAQATQDQITQLAGRITAATPSSALGRRESAQLASLQSEEQQLNVQLNGVDSTIVNTQLSNGTQAASTRVLQRATHATVVHRRLRALELAVLGAVLGLLIGAVIALFRSRRGDLLRFRGELAAALGVPVIASVGASSCSTADEWNEALERPGQSPATAWNLHQILRALDAAGEPHGRRVRILSFSDDAPASTVGPMLAAYAASTGVATAYHAPTSDDAFLQLRVAWSRRRFAEHGDLVVLDGDADGIVLNPACSLVSTELVDRREPLASRFEGVTVLAVSAGETTHAELAGLALGLDGAGSAIDAIVVVNPTPRDATSGFAGPPPPRRASSLEDRTEHAGSTTGK